jgi:hypothetical protein
MRGLSTTARGELRGRCVAPAGDRGVAPRRVEVELSPQSVERVALRVAELLERRRVEAQDDLICAGELAGKLGVRRSWVYRHAIALGGIRMDDGPKAEWRFEFERARANLRRLQSRACEEQR